MSDCERSIKQVLADLALESYQKGAGDAKASISEAIDKMLDLRPQTTAQELAGMVRDVTL